MDFEVLQTHWSFLVVALAIGLVGEVVKRLVLPKDNPAVLRGWRGVFRVTLPLHPALVGLLVGCIPGMPCPESFCTNLTSVALYYMGAGITSAWVFAGLKHVLKERAGIEIT